MRQAQHFYRDKYRTFPKIAAQGELLPDQVIEVNKEISVDGQPVILNDISQMPLCDVIIKEDENGLINRHMKRLSYAEIIRILPPELQLLRTWWATKLNDTFELDDFDREIGKKIGQMEMALAVSRASGEMANIEASKAQSQALIQQILSAGGQIPAQPGLPSPGVGGPRPAEPTEQEVQAQLVPAQPSGPRLLGGQG
jgi:TATA-binding protein-associated factor Taf7